LPQPANLTSSGPGQILLFYKLGLNVDKHVKKLFYRGKMYLCGISTDAANMETDLSRIAAFAHQHQAENDRFAAFLKQQETGRIDALVAELDTNISHAIDCTACGNCCKSLMIVVTEKEADALSGHLQQPREEFDGSYLEKGSNGMMIINKIPCHFLSDNKCTVYEHRFAGCREFPALHVPQFNKRLFTTFMHYDRCPIIFNVMEKLKDELEFEKDAV
jgi:Fe-S-cluster containining protein